MEIKDLLPESLQISSTILNTAGQLAKGHAYEAIGSRRQALSEFTAQQLEQDAEAAQGIGMRGAVNEQLKAKLVNSLVLARAAASGAGASDPTVLNIMAQTSGESAYRQALAMYEGESQARLSRLRATAARYEGATAESDAGVAKDMSDIGAASTLLSGGAKVASMFEKYWSGV